MQFISKKEIKLDKELSDLDEFTLDFVKLLRRHTPYVIVSGYVSILLGRARGSEDVDILIPELSDITINNLISDLIKTNFYCLNAEELHSIFEYFKEKIPVRFAKENTVIPNIELKIAKNKIDIESLQTPIKVTLDHEELFISNLELQIAFKEVVLKSPKDIEDARHLRNIASSNLDTQKIQQYMVMLDGV